MDAKEYTNIALPNELIYKIQKHIEGSDFKSVSEYISFVLEEILADQEQKPALTEEEERQVKKTLKNLGYLE